VVEVKNWLTNYSWASAIYY